MAEKTEFLQAIDDAILDADSLEQFINGSDSETVLTRLSAKYPTLQKAIKQMFENGGLPATPFKTKSLMTASALTDGKYAVVTDDNVNNGLYVKTDGQWIISEYDPINQTNKSIDKKLGRFFSSFATKSDLVSSGLPDGSSAIVTDGSESGFYKKISGGWVKAEYNPKDSLDNLASVVPANTSDIVRIEDSAGQFVYKATNEGKHYFAGISNDLQSELEDKSVVNTANINSIFEFKDDEGGVTFRQDVDGDLFTPRVGNLTQSVLDNKADIKQIKDNYNHYSTSSTLGIYAAGKYYDRAHADFSETTNKLGFILTPQNIDSLGMYDYKVNVLRIPSMLRLDKNKFLIGFESRLNWADVGQNSATSCIMTVNEDTHEVTVSDIQNIGKYYIDELGKWRSYMNPGFVMLDDKKTVFVFYLRRYQRTEHQLYMRKSTDGGKTWGAEKDMSHIYNQDHDWAFLCCNSNGFVKKYGRHKGRLIVPSFYANSRYTSDFLNVNFIYSDDDGETWHVGEGTPWTITSEAQFIEDFNGDMLVSSRTGDLKHLRYFIRYVDETGEYIMLPRADRLDNEASQGGLVRGENEFDDSTAKIVYCGNTYGYKHLPGRQQRSGLSIGISYDAMQSWIAYNVPELDLAHTGYSNIDFLDENHLICVHEGENTTLKYAIIPLANILKQGVR